METLKSEPSSKRAKVEAKENRCPVKSEVGCGTTAGPKLEQKVKAERLPGLGASGVKAELLRQQCKLPKQETKLKCEAPSSVAQLVERGLQLRAEAARVKQESKCGGQSKVRVKKEGQRKTRKKRGKGRRGSAKRRNASREAMNRAVPLSPELGALVGASELSRPEVLKRLWAHFREKGLLNPADKREAVLDAPLQELFGRTSVRIFQLNSLLVPHLNYAAAPRDTSQQVPETKPDGKIKAKVKVKTVPKAALLSCKTAVKSAEGSSGKRERGLEHQPKREHAAPSLHPPPQPKDEVTLSAAKPEGSQLKREVTAGVPGPDSAVLAAQVRSVVPRLRGMHLRSAVVEFSVPSGSLHLEVRAEPQSSGAAAGTALRCPCAVEFCEGVDGEMVQMGSAVLQELDPAATYRVSVFARLADGTEASSVSLTLPQRAAVSRWGPSEVQLFCSALRLPDLGLRAREYGVDGTTLLAFQEEDLRALGVTAPFLLKRVLGALQELQAD